MTEVEADLGKGQKNDNALPAGDSWDILVEDALGDSVVATMFLLRW
jgi:hypothetical protein